jgi:D-glycero-D-manno-heptose 1,7-bisphosphate phosphatase
VPFLGGTANLARGMGLLACQTGAPILPLVMRRVSWRRFEIEFFPVLRADAKAPRDAEEARLTRETLALFDAAIRADPGQWFWYNKRWVLDPVEGADAGAEAKCPAMFFDRDDTLAPDAGYMHDPDQIRLLPGAAEALRAARAVGVRLYLHTNQSGIGRGYFTMEDALACNRRLEALLFGEGNRGFDGFCIAPEKPDEPSTYRKPSPAFVRERIEADGLDPSRCAFIGDKIVDIRCGVASGIASALVAPPGAPPRADAAAFATSHGIAVYPGVSEAVLALLERWKLKGPSAK